MWYLLASSASILVRASFESLASSWRTVSAALVEEAVFLAEDSSSLHFRSSPSWRFFSSEVICSTSDAKMLTKVVDVVEADGLHKKSIRINTCTMAVLS